MQNEKVIGLVAKCLEMVNSDQDGEVLAAARKANLLRSRLGVGWEEMLRGMNGSIQHGYEILPLETEINHMRSRLTKAQNELIQARKAAHSAEIEARALREMLTESTQAMEKRERELCKQQSELESRLADEQTRHQKTRIQLADFSDAENWIKKRTSRAEHQTQEATARMRALERANTTFMQRELGLRASLEKMRFEIQALRRELGQKKTHHMNIAAQNSKYDFDEESYVEQASILASDTLPRLATNNALTLQASSDPLLKISPFMARPFVISGASSGVIVEIKPLTRLYLYANLKRARVAMEYAQKTGSDYVMVSPSGVTLDMLFSLKIKPEATQAVLNLLDQKGQISWADYREIRGNYGLKPIHTGGIVVQNDLFFTRMPWHLRRLTQKESFATLRRVASALATH